MSPLGGVGTSVALATIELEAMLFVRHLTLTAARRAGGLLDRSSYTILACLASDRIMSLGELAETLGLDVSTLSRQTSGMLKDGLIQRISDPDGRLARKFQSTPAGEVRLAEACAANLQVLQAATSDWSADDLAAFSRYLEQFNRGFEHLDNRPWPRRSETV